MICCCTDSSTEKKRAGREVPQERDCQPGLRGRGGGPCGGRRRGSPRPRRRLRAAARPGRSGASCRWQRRSRRGDAEERRSGIVGEARGRWRGGCGCRRRCSWGANRRSTQGGAQICSIACHNMFLPACPHLLGGNLSQQHLFQSIFPVQESDKEEPLLATRDGSFRSADSFASAQSRGQSNVGEYLLIKSVQANAVVCALSKQRENHRGSEEPLCLLSSPRVPCCAKLEYNTLKRPW